MSSQGARDGAHSPLAVFTRNRCSRTLEKNDGEVGEAAAEGAREGGQKGGQKGTAVAEKGAAPDQEQRRHAT